MRTHAYTQTNARESRHALLGHLTHRALARNVAHAAVDARADVAGATLVHGAVGEAQCASDVGGHRARSTPAHNHYHPRRTHYHRTHVLETTQSDDVHDAIGVVGSVVQ
jgi:hypothetical protein